MKDWREWWLMAVLLAVVFIGMPVLVSVITGSFSGQAIAAKDMESQRSKDVFFLTNKEENISQRIATSSFNSNEIVYAVITDIGSGKHVLEAEWRDVNNVLQETSKFEFEVGSRSNVDVHVTWERIPALGGKMFSGLNLYPVAGYFWVDVYLDNKYFGRKNFYIG